MLLLDKGFQRCEKNMAVSRVKIYMLHLQELTYYTDMFFKAFLYKPYNLFKAS